MDEFVTKTVIYEKAYRKVTQENEFTYDMETSTFQTDDKYTASIVVTPFHETVVIFEDGSSAIVTCEDDKLALKIAYNMAMIEHLRKVNASLIADAGATAEIHE